MKKNIIKYEAAALLIILLTLSIAVKGDPSIIVTDYQIEPEELMPGETGIITLNIMNAETIASTTETVGDPSNSISITEANGVVIDQIRISSASDNNGQKLQSILGANGYKDLGNLAPGSSMSISFEVIADDNISDGYYFPNLHIDLKNDMNGNYDDVIFPLKIRVNNESFDFIPDMVPSTISLSGATDISFKLINKRESPLNNIIITPRNLEDLSILPEKNIIDQLSTGETKEIHFSLIPTEIGSKEIIFDINYSNGINHHTQSTSIKVDIINSYDVAPIIYSIPSTIEHGKKENIRLKVYNTKSEEISSVIITPISEARITPSQYFIGSMGADDIYSISFDIDSTDLKINQTYDIEFLVSFKQDGITYETPVIQSSFRVVPEKTNGEETMIITAIVLIALLAVIYYIFRIRKKQRLKKLSTTKS